MAFALLLSCGVALALTFIACEGEGKRCVGTNRPDLMKGTGDIDAMYGRDKGDTLKGFGDTDALLGQKGEDTLIGGPGQDFLIGGLDDDRLRGEEALDIYYFERPNWGRDTVTDASPRNILRLPDGEGFSGPVTTNLDSDDGPLPEVSYPGGASTVNWRDDAITIVIGSTGDDTVTGSNAANMIFDGEGRDTDADTVSGAGGKTSWTCRTAPPTTRWSSARATTRFTSIRNSKWSSPTSAKSKTPFPIPRKRRGGTQHSGWGHRKRPRPVSSAVSRPQLLDRARDLPGAPHCRLVALRSHGR
jgi:hypothetical protein